MYKATISSTILLSLLRQQNMIPTNKIAYPNSKLLTCRSVHKYQNIQALINRNAQRSCLGLCWVILPSELSFSYSRALGPSLSIYHFLKLLWHCFHPPGILWPFHLNSLLSFPAIRWLKHPLILCLLTSSLFFCASNNGLVQFWEFFWLDKL